MIFLLLLLLLFLLLSFLQNQTEYLNTELVKSMYLVAKKGKIVLGFHLCMICISNKTTELHAVQFGINWMRRVLRTSKLDVVIGRV